MQSTQSRKTTDRTTGTSHKMPGLKVTMEASYHELSVCAAAQLRRAGMFRRVLDE